MNLDGVGRVRSHDDDEYPRRRVDESGQGDDCTDDVGDQSQRRHARSGRESIRAQLRGELGAYRQFGRRQRGAQDPVEDDDEPTSVERDDLFELERSSDGDHLARG